MANRCGRKRGALLLIAWSALAAACSSGPLPGLQPEYPAVKRSMSAPLGAFVAVDSLRPTLRWRLFPGPEHRKRDVEHALDRVREVRYELRVWRTEHGHSGELVYERDDLGEPHHALEESLEPSTNYLWTVRARFELDGTTFVTEWGLSSTTLRNQIVPNPSCFRFRTPAATP